MCYIDGQKNKYSEKTKCIFVSQHQNAGHNCDINIAKRSFQNVAQFEYLGRTVKKTLLPQSASELYRPSDRRLSAKLVPTLLRIEGATWSA
jgi:hypothetical protein